MKRAIIFILVVLLMGSCHTSKNISGNNTADRDGSSFEKAVIIQEKSEMTGVSAEYSWLSVHYPGYQTEMQSLMIDKKMPYDVLKIKTTDGVEKKVYFDIHNYFGKF